MHHFGLICPPGPSHVTGLTTIARELCRRGHRATVFNIPDVEDLALKEGVEFHAVGARDHPKGAFNEFSEKFGRMHGVQAMRFGLKVARDEITMLLNEAPDAMRSARVTALLVDQGQPAGSTIAERLALPFITVCNAVHADPDPNVPPSVVGWGPPTSWAGRVRIRVAYKIFDLAVSPLRNEINRYRRAWGLTPLPSLYDSVSRILELAQQTKEFDFPRQSIPRQFHYIGLIRRLGSSSIPFPSDRLDGRPLVYGSLGTVAVDSQGVFRMLAEACAELNVQLVMTLGGRGDPNQYAHLPGNPIVVTYAPQLALFERAQVTVCHAGHNTVLESLASGVPVVAVPHNADQYGVAARLAHSGAGIAIPLTQLSASQLRTAIERLLTERSYTDRAHVIRSSIERAGGEVRAADLIEQYLAG
jgi:MGT family glycosyltransferase